MTPENLRQIIALGDDRDQKHYAWIRQLLVLASGTLAALVAFRAGAQSTGIALLALRIAWVALGLSILLGALSLRGEVSKAALLVKAAAAKAIEQSRRGETWTSPVVAAKPAIYRWAEVLFYLALIVAVVALVVHAVLRI
jgi:hypothetical protein